MRARDARDDAKEFLQDNFLEEIVEQLVDGREVSDDINNDYYNGDGLFHEQITDKDYSPTEAVAVLEEYDDHEETDYGLWEGVSDWRRILGTIAAYTYSNAVMSEIRNVIDDINDIDVDEMREELIKPLRAEHESEQAQLAEENTEHEPEDFDEDEAAEKIEDELRREVEREVLSILS